MKHFGEAILQLEVVSTDTVLRIVKQAIYPNTQFLDLLSLHPPLIVEELFQRGNQCAMLEEDKIVGNKSTIAVVSDSRHDSNSRGKRGCDDHD